ncbi:MAG: rhomboid family intramembrane serine protease [Fervidicoccaceae archaeon]
MESSWALIRRGTGETPRLKYFPTRTSLPGISPKRGVTLSLVAINAALYLMTSSSNFFLRSADRWVSELGFVPAELAVQPSSFLKIFTSMFTHADVFHIFFNMYFLYFFGKALEGVLGSGRFLTLYMLSGVAAAVAHTAFGFVQGVSSLIVPAVGASGAISGVLGAYLLLFPGTHLTACLWFFVLPLCFTTRASYFLLFWFATQVIYGYASRGAAVAFFAHAGGFVAGIALLPLLLRGERLASLKYYVALREGLFSFIRFFGQARPSGLGRGGRLALAILVVSMIAGLAYVNIAARPGLSASLLELNVDETLKSSGRFLVTWVNGSPAITGSELMPDAARITLNRLWGSGLLYNPTMKGGLLEKDSLTTTARVLACPGSSLEVPVQFRGLVAVYDERGLAKEARGILASVVVNVTFGTGGACSASPGEPFVSSFEVSSRGSGDLGLLAEYSSIASLIIVAASLYVAVARDKHYALVS